MAAKANQVLQIDPPQEIIFRGPFTDVVTSSLKLINPSDRQVCFKVKTTAPKQYCVRPNSGLIPPKGVVNVAVMLQPFDYNAEEKSKHKFMIQTAFVPDGETSLDNIWKNVTGDELMDSKLKVLFEIPEANNLDKSTSKQTPQKTVNAGAGSDTTELRRLQSENKNLQTKVQQLESENDQLRTRVSRSESTSMQQKHGSADSSLGHGLGSDFKLLHVIIAAIVALLLGLIFGKVI